MEVNRLSLNISKTYFLKINANRSKKVVFDGYTITEVDWVEYFG